MSQATSGASPASNDRRAGASEGRSKPRSTPKTKRPPRNAEPLPATLGREALSLAQQRAATILEVLAGEQTVGEAARLLGISVMRYYLLERRALQGLTAACAPRPKGPPSPGPEQELPRLRRELERCRRECLRQAALVRATQRAIGFPVAAVGPAKGKAPPQGKPEPASGKRRRRQATIRALRAAQGLRQNSSGRQTPDVVERSPAEGDAPRDTTSGPLREGEPARGALGAGLPIPPPANETTRTVTQVASDGTQGQEAARHGPCGAAGGIRAGQAAADHHPPDAAG